MNQSSSYEALQAVRDQLELNRRLRRTLIGFFNASRAEQTASVAAGLVKENPAIHTLLSAIKECTKKILEYQALETRVVVAVTEEEEDAENEEDELAALDLVAIMNTRVTRRLCK